MPKPAFYTESQLVFLLKHKDQNAFSYLYDHYCAALNGIITRTIGISNSEDLLQDTFIKIWNKFEQFDSSKSTLFTWMAAIARNCAIDASRSKSFRLGTLTTQNDLTLSTVCDGHFTSSKHDHLGITKYWSILKPLEKEVMFLVYYDGHSHAEVSKNTGIPLGSVKTLIHKSIRKLRNVLTDNYSAVA